MRHAYNINEKGNILVKLGQFKYDLSKFEWYSFKFIKFLGSKNASRNLKNALDAGNAPYKCLK